MALVPYTLVSWAESDATGTNGKNIIENAVVSLFLPETSTAITLYDNASSGNPSTSKSTGTDGQVTFWCETGNYDLEVNGQARGTISVATALEATTGPTDNTVGRVTKVGDGGLNSSGINITDFNDISDIASQFLRADPSAANTPPDANTNNWAGLRSSRFPTTFFDLWAGLTENRYWLRAFNSDSFRDFVEIYHTGNLNVNEFGGLAANDVISSKGYRRNSVEIRFSLDISSFASPSSVTVVSDFYIFDPEINSVIANNVVPEFDTTSSNKECIVKVTGLSGISRAGPYLLQSETSFSKITVNF